MIISTTSQLEGRPIAEYLGVVSSESVQGINFVRDFFTRFRDFSAAVRKPWRAPCVRPASRPLKSSWRGHGSCKPMQW